MTEFADSAPTAVDESTGARIEYRLTRGVRDGALVVLPGAHMPAGGRFGEDALAAGRSVLVVSRPGYGRTARAAGPTPAAFAACVADLCRRLGLADVTAVGISMGARTAVALAATAPALVRRVVLLCPVSELPWPESRRTRLLSRLMFSAVTERGTWGLVHTLLRRRGVRALPLVLGGLTTLPPDDAVARLGTDRDAAVRFLLGCRSGQGWGLDLRPAAPPAGAVEQPVLVVATPYDGSVGLRHPEHLAATLPYARLVLVETPTHLVWLGAGSERTAAEVGAFLGA